MKIGTQDFTVEGYVYALSINRNSQYRREYLLMEGTEQIQFVYINPSTGYLFGSDDSSAKITELQQYTKYLETFALTRSGSAVQLHVNGTVEGTTLTDTGNKTQAFWTISYR